MIRSFTRFSAVVAIAGAFVLSAARTAAADTDPKKAEAAQRFDRGLQLFDDGDTAGALAEFKRTYELVPNPVVLFNIGLVYAAMGRPVDAVDALEKVLQTPEKLSTAQRERATRTLNDQKARIGRLTVTTTPDGARIDIDNVEVARTPLTAPIRVSEGSHVVGAVAEGYAPDRKEIVVAGNADAAVHFDLVSTQGKQIANLTVQSRIAGAEVRLDDKVAGKTPLATSLTLLAGHHVVELRRPGYKSSKQEVDVGAGSTGELTFDLAVDPAQLGTEGALLAIDPSEPSPDVFVDEEHIGPYSAPLRLPRGPHHLRIEHGGFLPVERDVTLEHGQTTLIHVDFDPTPEQRVAYEKSAHLHRTWGLIGIIGGAAIAGGGVAWLLVNKSSKDDAQAELDTANNALANQTPPHCDIPAGNDPADCQQQIDTAQSKLNSAKSRDVVGYVGIGVGGAALVTGVILLLTGDDPSRYDRPAKHDIGKDPLTPRLAFGPGPGQLGGALNVAF